MAKKALGDLVGTQKPIPQGDPDREMDREMGRTISVGVGLKEGEVAEIDELAGDLGFARNAVLGWLIRYGMRKIRDGDLSIPVEETTVKRLGEA